jgi:hypothetical protein
MNFFDAITTGVSIPLTTLASGYRPQGLINEEIFPIARSPLSAGQIPLYGKDSFKIYETRRARMARSNRAQIDPDSWISFSCVEHDLAIPMDQQELNELKAIPGDSALKAFFDLQNRTRVRVQWNMALEKEKAVADMVQSTANFPTGHYVTLTTTDCWSETGSTPIQDIETGREKIRSATGVYPNAIFMGSAAYDTLKFHAQYQGILNANADKIITLEFIKLVHNFTKATIGKSMYLDPATGSFADLWNDDVILCYIPEGLFPDYDEPSFGYTIRPTYNPTPYPYVDIFDEEGGKLINVRCTDKYTQKLIIGACGYLIKNVKK